MDLRRAQRPREPAGPGPAGPGSSPRGRRGRGDRAQPGLDGRRPGDLQGRRGVPAHRAALPGRPHRQDAVPGRVRARADRTGQHGHARPGPGRHARRQDALRRGRLRRGPRRRRPRHRGRARPARLHLLHQRLHRRAQGRDVRARGHAQPPVRQDRGPGDRRGPGGRADRAAVLRHLDVAAGVRAPGRRADADRRAGGDPGRRAVRRHDRRRPGQRPAGGAVLPRGGAVLPGPESPGAAGPAVRVGDRRGAEEGARAALVRGQARDQAGQRVRADRDLGRHQPRGHGPGAGRRAGPARPRRSATCASTWWTRTCGRCRSARPA